MTESQQTGRDGRNGRLTRMRECLRGMAESQRADGGDAEIRSKPRRRRLWKALAAAAVIAVVAGVAIVAVHAIVESRRTEFPMEEGPIGDWFTSPPLFQGCQPPSPDVRYPDFKSAKPLYGCFVVGSTSDPGGRQAKYYFAVDESKGTGTGYDTFLLDGNHNLDLSDDEPARGHSLSASGRVGQKMAYDSVPLRGAGEGGEDIVVEPQLFDPGDGSMMVRLLPGFARYGLVRIGGAPYYATLVRGNILSNRCDLPSVTMNLQKVEYAGRADGQAIWGFVPYESFVSSVYIVQGRTYSLSVTAAGDKVTVHRHEGIGVLRVVRGGLTLGCGIAEGALHTRDGALVNVPAAPSGGSPVYEDKLVPVGVYALASLDVRVDRFRLTLEHRRQGPGPDKYLPRDYLLAVRSDMACDLSFPTSAQVTCTGLDELPVFQPGDTVAPAPRIVTPDFQMSRIWQDAAQPTQPGAWLHPTVEIVDSSGKTLFRGDDPDAKWTIPSDFLPRGGKETLVLTVTWDTKELFGVLKSQRGIVIESTDTGSSGGGGFRGQP